MAVIARRTEALAAAHRVRALVELTKNDDFLNEVFAEDRDVFFGSGSINSSVAEVSGSLSRHRDKDKRQP